jgi:hypothetical protein
VCCATLLLEFNKKLTNACCVESCWYMGWVQVYMIQDQLTIQENASSGVLPLRRWRVCQYIHVLSQLDNAEVPVHDELCCCWIQAISVRWFSLYLYIVTTGVAEERDYMYSWEYTSNFRDMALYDQSMLAGYKICKISFAKHSPNCYAFAHST